MVMQLVCRYQGDCAGVLVVPTLLLDRILGNIYLQICTVNNTKIKIF